MNAHTVAIKSLLTVTALPQQKRGSERCVQWRVPIACLQSPSSLSAILQHAAQLV